jgi:hypothetical protein
MVVELLHSLVVVRLLVLGARLLVRILYFNASRFLPQKRAATAFYTRAGQSEMTCKLKKILIFLVANTKIAH